MMGEVFLARWQFAITSTYHWLFVPLTLGLTVLIAIMEIIYVRSGNEVYKRMARFWGKLFLINFAVGVVTGIVQEFHFGMNWSEYSRFMGDIFGAPLALEALTAFYLESVFIGVWIFGWDRLSPKAHAIVACLVAFGTNLSALWILTANSFMQHPVGYVLRNGRAEMEDFGQLLMNPYLHYQFPHVIFAGIATAATFIVAISAWHMLRKNEMEFFGKSMKLGLTALFIGTLCAAGMGHWQTQHLEKAQPMKLAALEALWETTSAAPLSLYSSIDEKNQKNNFSLEVPNGLSLLLDKDSKEPVIGLKDLNKEYATKYGPGDYIPPVTPVFWTFRIMVGVGMLMLLLGGVAWYMHSKQMLAGSRGMLKALFWLLPLSYLCNASGWFVTEAGRQPWLVYGLQTTAKGVSPNVTATEIWMSMIGFTIMYAVMAAAAVYLAKKAIVAGPADLHKKPAVQAGKEETIWN